MAESADPPPNPSAVRTPMSYAGQGSAGEKLARLQTEFAPILGVVRVYIRHNVSEHFISGDPQDALYFPANSERRGEERYTWTERGGGDGVLYGVLKPGA